MSATATPATPATKPTVAFVAASWAALVLGVSLYLVGLWNADMQLNEKGYYLTLLLFGLFAAVSIQKSVRDRAESIPVTGVYYGLAWFSVTAALTLLAIGLINADLLLSEKGFYAVCYAMSLFAVVAVQKNVRDLSQYDRERLQASEYAPNHPAPDAFGAQVAVDVASPTDFSAPTY